MRRSPAPAAHASAEPQSRANPEPFQAREAGGRGRKSPRARDFRRTESGTGSQRLLSPARGLERAGSPQLGAGERFPREQPGI